MNVSYQVTESTPMNRTDILISQACGKEPKGSGFYFPDNMRDLEFDFDTNDEYMVAKQRVLQIPGVTVV